MPSLKVKIDEAVVHKLFAAAFEGATGISELVRQHLGEEEPDGAAILAMHTDLTITPRPRQSGDNEPDFADVAATVEIVAGDDEEQNSSAAITSAAAEVAAALDEFAREDINATDQTSHILSLDRAVVKISSGVDLRAASKATVTVTGTAQRLSGNSRIDFTAS